MRYTAIVERGKESGFVAYIPALKGCVSQGPTPDAAMANLKEAAEAYVKSLNEDDLPVPQDVEVRHLELGSSDRISVLGMCADIPGFSTEDFLKSKQEEIEIEEAKFRRIARSDP